MQSTHPQLGALRALLTEMRSVVVAFSGGIDSALVLKVATDVLGDRAVGLTAVGPALAERERDDARRIAETLGARHLFVDSREIDDPNYRENPQNRCYFCKSELYRITEAKRIELGFDFTVNGTNKDDLGDYRPGLTAADEAKVRSPLVEVGIDKDGVRALAKTLEMAIWDKPAAACLASRIPYGTAVTPERLAQIGGLEAALKDLGLRQVRVRYHGELARIEVGAHELEAALALRQAITRAGRAHGFVFVTLDLEGYRTGSFNALLPIVQ
jgi:uncharacterized protein